jgi:hypothetical protein
VGGHDPRIEATSKSAEVFAFGTRFATEYVKHLA